jgi:hypothetical protein
MHFILFFCIKRFKYLLIIFKIFNTNKILLTTIEWEKFKLVFIKLNSISDMQISKYLDPFSIPTQLNNLWVLIVAYVARSTNS